MSCSQGIGQGHKLPVAAGRIRFKPEVIIMSTQVVYAYDAHILPLVVGNPYRDGSARADRFSVLASCRTVGEFLAQFPQWNATITRNIDAGNIAVAEVLDGRVVLHS
jgi:hypothetical protein